MVMSAVLDWEIDNDSIVLELNMEVALVFNSVWNLYTDLCWGLVPRVSDFGVLSNKLFLGDVLFSELYDVSTRNSLKL